MKWSFSYNSFLKLLLYNTIHIPMDPKHRAIKGLYCMYLGSLDIKSKKVGKDLESIQSSTTPDPGHHMITPAASKPLD